MLVSANEPQAAQLSIPEIKYALEHDPEFLIQFFLQEHLTHPVPEFHKEIFELMTSLLVEKFACAVPRGHAKTTLAKLTCVWYFLFTDFRFILYVSNTLSIAVPSCNDIIGFLESENFQAVFGEVRFETKKTGVGEYKFWIGDKLCFLRAFGVGQQVRGINIDNERPQLGILDDVDAFAEEITEQSFRSIKRWFAGPFRKAFSLKLFKLIQIGNLTENMSLIAEHTQSEFWHSRVYGCLLENGQPLWKDFWTIEKLRADYQEYLEAHMADVWFAEMMNMPSAGGRGVILPEEIYYQPHRIPEELEYGFITIDLSISDKTWAHETVLCVHGFIPDAGTSGIHQIVDYQGWTGIDPIRLFWEVIRYCKKWNINTIGIESVAYQAALIFVFEHECRMNNIPFNPEHSLDNKGLTFVPLYATQRKAARIISWASMVKSQQYAINEGDFRMTQQLLAYIPDKKNNIDDYIDSAAYGPQMIKKWMHLILRIVRIGSSTTITPGIKFCGD